MELGLILLVPIVSVVVAVLCTRKNQQIRLERWVGRQVPAEDGADAYRQPAWTTRIEQETEIHATDSLPSSTRAVAGLLRFAVCLASIFVVPVLLASVLTVCDGHPGAILYLGLPGLALAFGQYLARCSLLAARPSSPAVARSVGIWTILHNLGIFAAVFVCSQPGFGNSRDWEALPFEGGGIVFFGYAVCSIALGILLVRAGSAQRTWLEANDALSPAAESVTA